MIPDARPAATHCVPVLTRQRAHATGPSCSTARPTSGAAVEGGGRDRPPAFEERLEIGGEFGRGLIAASHIAAHRARHDVLERAGEKTDSTAPSGFGSVSGTR